MREGCSAKGKQMKTTESQIPHNQASGASKEQFSSEQGQRLHDLGQLLSQTPAPPALVIPSFLSVLAAVEAAHRENKGHCDLDPQKVRFRSDGTVEVSILSMPVSGATVVLRSAKYSAPEMVEETGEPVYSALLDSYVLGFVFYEILLGRDLFEKQFQDISPQGEWGWLAWHADKSRRARPLSDLVNGFPSTLSRLIGGMIAKEASERVTDLKGIAEIISVSSHATMVFRNLSASRGHNEALLPRREPAYQKVDAFWKQFMALVADLQKAFLARIVHRGRAPALASAVQQSLEHGKANSSAQYQNSPSKRKARS
jgi:serine/threonine protein kinase